MEISKFIQLKFLYFYVVNLFGEYIKFKLNSKGKHAIHSPFVFDFVSQCRTISLSSEEKEHIQQIRTYYSKNHQVISVHDAGVGSKKMGKQRKISSIHHTSSSKGTYALLLFQLARFYNPKNILELGTSLGIGTLHFQLGNPDSHIVSIDACKNTQDVAKSTLAKTCATTTFVCSTFLEAIPTLEKKSFDLIYIDGHHDGKALLNYLELLEPYSTEESIFVLDDIRWSDSMLSAWEHLCQSERYHVSLDLFRMGILVKRTHQAKEHFNIKTTQIISSMI